MIVHIETRHKKRQWLPRWIPGNVYATIFHGDMPWCEAVETVRAAIAGHAFAAAAYGEDGLIATAGAVRVEDA